MLLKLLKKTEANAEFRKTKWKGIYNQNKFLEKYSSEVKNIVSLEMGE